VSSQARAFLIVSQFLIPYIVMRMRPRQRVIVRAQKMGTGYFSHFGARF
jgi:hypothetical protein